MDPIAFWNMMLGYVQGLAGRLDREFLTPANLAQIPAVLMTGGVAWLLSHLPRRWVSLWLERLPVHDNSEWMLRSRAWITNRLLPLLGPTVWAVGLWVALIVAERFGWPHDVATITINLLVAWLLIRLIADFVPYPALGRLIAVTAWCVAALNIVNLLWPTMAFLDSLAITVGVLRVSVLTVIRGVVSLGVLLWAASLVSRLFENRITKVPEITPRARVLLGKLIKVTLVTLAVILSLTSIGLDLSTLAVFTGAVGIGLGLGLQKTSSNLFSGFILLLDRSIKPGDVIEVGGTYGWVSAMGARYVSVETRDGTEFLIPNEDMITHQVLNWSHKSDRVRLKVPVRVPHDADLDHVMSLMLEAAARPARTLKVPAPLVIIIDFGETAIDLELRFWINDARNGVRNVKSQVLYEIWRLFRRDGIHIPYPKRDLYMRANTNV
jgi:small-conductance mechanosensitive channel